MYLVADDAQILIEKDIAWSAINLPGALATPSSLEENNLLAEDQQPNEPRRKSEIKNNLQKVQTIDCFTMAKYFQQKKF